MKKKVLALLFATTMLAGVSMTVSATGSTTGGKVITTVSGNETPTISSGDARTGDEIQMKSSVKQAHIEVTISINGEIKANPYELGDASVAIQNTATMTGAKIVFTNKSDTQIEVSLTGKTVPPTYTGTVTSAQKVVLAANESETKTAGVKNVFVKGEIAGDGNPTTTSKYLVSSSSGKKASVTYGKTPATTATTVVLTKTGGANTTDGTSDVMTLIISGATGKSPTSEWNEDDVFTVVTIYDLKLTNKAATQFKAPTA